MTHTTMRQPRSQESYSCLWPSENGQTYATKEEAKRARDARYRELRAAGFTCRRWTLPNQLKPYAGLGIPDGRISDVYMINVDLRRSA